MLLIPTNHQNMRTWEEICRVATWGCGSVECKGWYIIGLVMTDMTSGCIHIAVNRKYHLFHWFVLTNRAWHLIACKNCHRMKNYSSVKVVSGCSPSGDAAVCWQDWLVPALTHDVVLMSSALTSFLPNHQSLSSNSSGKQFRTWLSSYSSWPPPSRWLCRSCTSMSLSSTTKVRQRHTGTSV